MEEGRVRHPPLDRKDVEANDRTLSYRDAERLRPAYEPSTGRRQGNFERYGVLVKANLA